MTIKRVGYTVFLIALAAVAAVVGLYIAGGAYTPSPAGLPDPGPLVGWGLPIVRTATNVAAVLTIGWLVSAAFLQPSGKDGVVTRIGKSHITWAGRAAWAWAALALAQAVLLLASVLGSSLADATNPQIISTYIGELPSTRALLVMSLLAAVIAIGCILTSKIGATAAWVVLALVAAALPALGGHNSGLGDHALATTAGAAHIVAAMLWIGGLAALAMSARESGKQRDHLTGPSLARSVERFSPIALVAIVLLAASGLANAYTRMDSLSELVTTGYGLTVLTKVVLLGGLAVLGATMRQRVLPTLRTASRRTAFVRVALIELAVMMLAVGLGVALANSPTPRASEEFNSLGESLLGFAYPPPPDAMNVAFGFRLEPFFFTVSLIAAALYIVGVIKVRQRGGHWPIGRTISWLIGIGIVIWTTNAGISVYAQVSVGLHMLQHMTMTMLAPIALVLGAPATLALRALKPAPHGERGPREWLVWLLHSWITRILTNPFYVFFTYVLGLYALYMTGLFGWLMGSHIGHIVMQLHFILSGYLFYWVLIGIDPRPKPLPYWGRLVMLLLALGVHGFFAVILMMGTTPLAVDWYGVVRPVWVTDPLADTLFGGQIAWGLSEIPTVIVLLVIAVQWARSDDREAKRKDRQADRDGDAELNAYNERLARIAARDERMKADQ